ncbi:MAG: DUF1772 domain-containing protein [Desulfobacteraceae bacterium]|nr:MAG: DUF1772 domain-containing protein [Desulfobacteraceae bacterium]
MLVKMFRFIAIMLTALSMGVALCHLLEMPAKMTFDAALWLTLLQTLYPPAFGPIGGYMEVGAVVTTVLLTFMVRRRRPAFHWTFMAAFCMVAAHAAFWILIAPVNAAMLPLTPETVPADWMRLRDQWEYTHAARAVVQIVALGALVLSIIVETPTRASRGPLRA